MKLLRFFSIAIFFQTAVLISFAQNAAQADKILKSSKAKFDALTDFTANFSYTLSNPNLKKAIMKKGELKIKKSKYKIMFPEEEFYCDGKKVWVFLKPENEVTISDFDPNESMSVDRMYKIYDGKSKTRYEGMEGLAHKITVFITDDKSEIFKAEIWIGKHSELLERGILFGKNGSQYNYDLKNMKTNVGLTDSEFVFDLAKHPGVYENRLDK